MGVRCRLDVRVCVCAACLSPLVLTSPGSTLVPSLSPRAPASLHCHADPTRSAQQHCP